MDEIDTITDYIQREAGLTAELIWGNCIDESLGDKISVTIIATGFKTSEELGNFRPEPTKIVHELNPAKKLEPLKVQAPIAATNIEQKVEQINEPTLIKKEEKIEKEEPKAVEFVFNNPKSEPKPEIRPKVESPYLSGLNQNQKQESLNINPPKETKSAEELSREQARERIMKLKGLSLKLSNVNDLEKEPAYKRKNIQLDKVTPSNQTNVSRYTLGEDVNGNVGLKDNSFLHDNVD